MLKNKNGAFKKRYAVLLCKLCGCGLRGPGPAQFLVIAFSPC